MPPNRPRRIHPRSRADSIPECVFGALRVVALALFTTACQSTPDTDATATGETWISLFNGEDLTGWTPKFSGEALGVNYRSTFQARDGVLVVSYDAYESFDGKFGHLFHEHEYSDYVLELEYRFVGEQVPGGPGWAFRNNGVMIHGQPPQTMRIDQNFPVSIEVQMLGAPEGGEGARTTGNLCTPGTNVVYDGELDLRHCINAESETFRGDQWVKLRIEVQGSELIRHFINGDEVMRYTQPQLDDRDADARVLIDQRHGEKLLAGGTISLQAESHGTEFRRIRLLPSLSRIARPESIVRTAAQRAE